MWRLHMQAIAEAQEAGYVWAAWSAMHQTLLEHPAWQAGLDLAALQRAALTGEGSAKNMKALQSLYKTMPDVWVPAAEESELAALHRISSFAEAVQKKMGSSGPWILHLAKDVQLFLHSPAHNNWLYASIKTPARHAHVALMEAGQRNWHTHAEHDLKRHLLSFADKLKEACDCGASDAGVAKHVHRRVPCTCGKGWPSVLEQHLALSEQTCPFTLIQGNVHRSFWGWTIVMDS